jgi:hypothetical protein
MWARVPRSPDAHPAEIQVIHAWRQLLARWAVIGRIVESPQLPADQNIIVGGLSAFVRPSWVEAYLRAPFPHAGQVIIDACAAGATDAILLTDAEVAAANSTDGLFSIVLGHVWRMDRVPEAAMADALTRSVRSFNESHDGYRLALILSEGVGEAERQMFIGSGAWQQLHVFDGGNTAEPPVLVGMSRQEAASMHRSASSTAPLFVVREPRYGFDAGQRQLLLEAMERVGDKELADALGVGPHALRRRWQRIFRRIEALQPPDDPILPPGLDTSGKRTRVLLRIANEMHELRPHTCRRPLRDD